MRKGIVFAAVVASGLATSAIGGNPLQGEVDIEPASKIERHAGLWLDGQYIGAVKDLEGSEKLVLVPGEHNLLFKLIGYEDVASTITVEPGIRREYRLVMRPAADVTYPDEKNTAKLRIDVKPEIAAVFVNDRYVGRGDRFDGRGVRLSAGTYRLTIALPGYETFNTEVTIEAGQTYEIKTKLAKGSFGEQASELTARIPAE
jgi:hypothetical protein